MRTILVALLSSLFFSGAAQAQAWPSKPVRIIIPFAPGGPTDIIARIAGQKLTEILGQPMVIESRAGAGGNIGTAAVAKSAPDGYTMLMTSSAFAVNVSLSPNAGFDAERDFIPVVNLAKQANMIFVHPDLPVKSLAELLALAKTSKLAFASPGSGTTPHLTAENLFNVTSKLDVTAIHFRGAGPSAAAVVGGEPRIGAGAVSTPLPFVKSGKLRALAVSSSARIAALPDVPTFAEAGLKGVESYAWYGFFAPAKTPKELIAKLNAETQKIMKGPEFKKVLEETGSDYVGDTPENFAKFIAAEHAKWGKVAKDSGATLD
jgi:tripartite-type tricarboxylate transporter receptor subunit TctC